ncbi:unnamed protein product, partial [Mesorhabditis spiculigera]
MKSFALLSFVFLFVALDAAVLKQSLTCKACIKMVDRVRRLLDDGGDFHQTCLASCMKSLDKVAPICNYLSEYEDSLLEELEEGESSRNICGPALFNLCFLDDRKHNRENY